MVTLKKTPTSELGKWFGYIKKSFLPLYIILSLIFILFSIYGYLRIAVYQTGMQDGYNRAALDISAQSLSQEWCAKWVSIPTANGKWTTLINIACLQKPEAKPEETKK